MSETDEQEPYVPTPEELVGESHGYCYGQPVVLPPPEPVASPTILSPGYRFRRGTGSPFDALPNPGMDLGLSKGVPCHWCHFCQMSVDVRSEAYNRNQVFGQKHWCRRCGRVTASAVYYHVQALDEAPTALFESAQAWMHTPEEKG
jgi:hypothetical protein